MANTRFTLAIGATLLMTAACAHHPKQLPPPPPTESGPAEPYQAPATNQTGVGDQIVPGSKADFLRSAGTDTIHFQTDSYDVDAQDAQILDAQAAWLQRYPNKTITIEGHCDERGTREYNLGLGDRRANAAKNYLAAHGVPASRISTISYGKERPAAMGSDESSWAQNRRAVTVLLN